MLLTKYAFARLRWCLWCCRHFNWFKNISFSHIFFMMYYVKLSAPTYCLQKSHVTVRFSGSLILNKSIIVSSFTSFLEVALVISLSSCLFNLFFSPILLKLVLLCSLPSCLFSLLFSSILLKLLLLLFSKLPYIVGLTILEFRDHSFST